MLRGVKAGRLSLGSLLFLAGGLLVLASSLLYVGYNELVVRGRIAEKLYARGKSFASIVARAAADYLSFAEAGLKEGVQAIAVMRPGDSVKMLDAKREVFPFYSRLSVLDARGRITAISPEDPDSIGIDMGDKEYFRRASASGSGSVSNSYVSSFSGRPAADIAAPIPGGGVLVAELDLSRLSEILALVSLDEEADIVVADALGTVCASVDPVIALRRSNIRRFIAEALESRDGGYTDAQGQRRIGFANEAASYGWTVFVSYSEGSIFSLVDELRGLIAFGALAIAVATGLASYLVNKRIAGAFGRIGRLVASIRAGEEPDSPPEASSVKDFNALARDVIAMGRGIKARREGLESLLREKETLLKEIHHRVKNNLQVILSISSLQRNACASEEARQSLLEIEGRIHSLALVHERAYLSVSISRIELGSYLRDTCSFALQSRPLIALDFDADEVEAGTDLAIPLGLILNEIVSNSAKHAYAEGERGIVTIRLRREAGGILLEARDGGKGMDPEAAHRPESIGLVLIESLCAQIGASMSLTVKDGTAYSISYPL